jgi:transcriptional regulator with XRE-family HTH domain
MKTMAHRLQSFRKNIGLTSKEVARRISVAESTYRAWEAGRAIRGEPYLRLAETFRVSLGELFSGEPPHSSDELNLAISKLEEVLILLRKAKSRL